MNATSPGPRPSYKHLRRDIIFALSFLLVAAALALFIPARVELGQRILGVMSGFFVMFYANAVPKALTPLARLKDPARSDAIKRFVAWSMVLGGLGHAIAYIVLPIEWAIPVAFGVLASSLLIAVGRCYWTPRAVES